MNRRTIITILIAVIVAVVIGLLWLWFFGNAGTAPTQTGSFGTTTDRTVSTTRTGGAPTNIPSQVGQTAGSNGGTLAGGGYGGVYTPGGAGITATSTAPGVNWLSGGGTGVGLSGGSGTSFSPAAINQLNNGSVGGQVNVLGSYSNPSSGGSGSGLAAGLIAGTAVACTSFLVQGQVSSLLPSIGFVKTTDTTNASKNFMDCLARTIARAAVQQITNSVINWINSGFNGKPSFVTNYQQFFTNVADQAAGSFIQNYTNFAPYCTPFAKQIQIALAQSYARRNTAQSCSLSSLVGTNLFSGARGAGSGWGNLVSFTTNPSNNPYGSYMSAQGQLQGTLAQAAQNAARNISPGGFLNFQQPYNCKPSPAGGQPVCQYKITTPGSVIQDSLSKTLGVSQDTLTQAGISGSFDAIISALISQLMTRALQGGVSNLSGQNGYSSYYLTADQQAAQDQGQALLTQLQGLVVVAQQYGQSEQGSIQDIQNAQSQLNNLATCWQGAAASPGLTVTQQNIAASNATSTLNTLHSFDAQVDSLNAQITRANAAIATLQDLQTKTLGVASMADVTAVKTALSADDAQGLLIAQADVTQAQQDRATLQAQLGSLNTATAAGLQQCYAFH